MPAPRAASLRVFFALWPDAAAHERMAVLARDVVRQAGGRAPRPQSHHLTLAFVGEVEPARIAVLERIGSTAAQEAAPFVLALDRVGAFHHTGIAWLGTEALPVELTRLARTLREELASNGFPVEGRPFRAHVTLARRCESVAATTVEPVAWRVYRIALVASELRPEGSRYRDHAQWPLTGVR